MPILLLPLFHPLIVAALRRLFSDDWSGAYVQFLVVPFLLTVAAVVLDIGLFFVGRLRSHAVTHY